MRWTSVKKKGGSTAPDVGTARINASGPSSPRYVNRTANVAEALLVGNGFPEDAAGPVVRQVRQTATGA